MAKQDTTTETSMQSLFDPRSYNNFLRTFAEMNERFTSMMVDAGERTTEITTETAKEAFSNLRDMSQVREEPSDYAKAYSDFLQRQMQLASRTAQHLAEVTHQTAGEATQLASDAGKEMADKASDNVEKAADKATDAADKASKKAA